MAVHGYFVWAYDQLLEGAGAQTGLGVSHE